MDCNFNVQGLGNERLAYCGRHQNGFMGIDKLNLHYRLLPTTFSENGSHSLCYLEYGVVMISWPDNRQADW